MTREEVAKAVGETSEWEGCGGRQNSGRKVVERL